MTADEALAKALTETLCGQKDCDYGKHLRTPRAVVAAARRAGWVPLTEVEKALRGLEGRSERGSLFQVGVRAAADLVASLREKP